MSRFFIHEPMLDKQQILVVTFDLVNLVLVHKGPPSTNSHNMVTISDLVLLLKILSCCIWHYLAV